MASSEELLAAVRSIVPSIRKIDQDWAEALTRATLEFETGVNTYELPKLLQLARYPVGVETFLFDSMYLGKKRDEIYPEVLEELKRINNPKGYRIVNLYPEALFTGGIGSAKSTSALYTMAYQLYVLSCFTNPHEAFAMDSSSEILFVFMSKEEYLAQTVDYERFSAMVRSSPYFINVFPYNPRVKKRLEFPHRIEVKAVGLADAALGQNVFGALIDEINFMDMVENSKRTRDGGVYDEAAKVYAGMSRRRKSRFQSGGNTPGILCLVSSKQYPGEFTDKKLEEALTDPSIYVYDKCVWDIKPKGTYLDQWFYVYYGDGYTKPRILADSEDHNIEHVKAVPVEFRKEFEDDLIGSLRDIAGVSVLSKFPYIPSVQHIVKSFTRKSILSVYETTLETAVEVNLKGINKTEDRWVHIDLGVTSDAAGVSCGYVDSFKKTSDSLMLPSITMDFSLRVVPPKNDEIKFYRIRDIIIKLRAAGLPIKWVSFDSYQSVDSIQLLRQKGFIAGMVSMDKTINPYAVTKTAIMEGLLDGNDHEKAMREFMALEYIASKQKVDHPPHGSKDVSDSISGVVYGLTTRREIWVKHGVPIIGSISKMNEVNVKESNDV